MRKINKSCKLSTDYKKWVDGLDNDHPEYNSSSGKYYLDIVMNLFHCQGGLCAYTEMLLCNKDYYDQINWNQEGRYKKPIRNVEIRGQLEHFDPSLKKQKGWDWDNFFMADTDVNTKVKQRNVLIDPSLKPDHKDYDESKLLDYDFSKHIFIPNISLPVDTQKKVLNMIRVLGINFDPIIQQRRMYLEPIIKLVSFGVIDWDNYVPEQFPTAFQMIKLQKKKSTRSRPTSVSFFKLLPCLGLAILSTISS